jgi:hypothetical protein
MKSLLLFLALAAGAAHAVSPEEDRAERQRIAAERAQAETAYAQREQACRERFVVTSCVDEAKRERRRTLERLRQQEAVLDEGLRKQRAAERLEDIGGKVSGKDREKRDAALRAQQRERERSEAQGRATGAAAAAEAAASRAEAASAPAARSPSSAAHAQAAAQEAAKRAQDRQQREVDVREHKAAVAKRNQEHAASGKKPSTPLPVPETAGSAAR